MRDDFNSLKDVIIKRLYGKNSLLQAKYDCLKNRVNILQSSIDDLEQYDWRNNLILSSRLDGVSDDDLEETVSATLSDIDLQVTASDVEECHGIGQSDQNKSRKQLFALWAEHIVEKSWKTKKKWFPVTSPNLNFQWTPKSLPMKI